MYIGMYGIKFIIFAHWQALLFRPRVFSRVRALGCAAHAGGGGDCTYTMAQVSAAAGLGGACSGHSKSCQVAPFQTVELRDAEPPKTMATPKKQLYSLCCCCFSIRPSSSSHALHYATANVQQRSQHQAAPFVTAMGGALVRVRATIPVVLYRTYFRL